MYAVPAEAAERIPVFPAARLQRGHTANTEKGVCALFSARAAGMHMFLSR